MIDIKSLLLNMNEPKEKTFFQKYKEYEKTKYGVLTKEESLAHYKEYIHEHKEELAELDKKRREKYGLLNKNILVDETAVIQSLIKKYGWFSFGKKKFDCPTFEKSKAYYIEHSQLPKPCDECYKALIFWNGLTENNITNLRKMINAFGFEYRGKFNNDVVVFYFRQKDEMLEFIELLKKKIAEFDVKGYVQWRRACDEYQKLKPELWKNAKELLPDSKTM
jgi:hypothetical protein